MRRKNIKITVIGIIVILIFIGISFLFYFNSVVNRPLKDKNHIVNITVNDGEGLTNVINRLDENGYLRSKLITKLKVRMNYREINIIPGTYEVKSSISLNNLIKTLETEDVNKNIISITIPEGYSIEDMAKVFEENELFSKEEFINAIKLYELPEFVKDNPSKKYNLEGYLYPNTYHFEKDSTPEEVINIMINEFKLVLDEIRKTTEINIDNNDIERVITKASIIEREVVLEEEKKIVSSVIDNRFKNNMKLQFCSTVNYVIGYDGHEVLTYEDIKIDSPYNTYENTGLPVGPICSPSKSSIIAALQPENTDYLYFVLKEDGKSHYFSKTIEEHEAAKIKAEQGR